MTIKKQLILILLLVGSIPFISMGFTSYFMASNSIKKEAFAKIELARDLKKSQLETYFDMMSKNIINLSDNRLVHHLRHNLLILHNQFIADLNVNGPFEIINKPSVQALYAEHDSYFQNFIKTNNFYDLFIICAKHGHVMYTVERESDLGANVKTGPLRDSGLGKAWKKALETKQISLIDTAPYAPSNGDPAMFMSYPLMDDDEQIHVANQVIHQFL